MKKIKGVMSLSADNEWMGQALLVEVKQEAHFINLLKLAQISDIPVRVSAHYSPNFFKGVVRFRYKLLLNWQMRT